MPNLIVTLYRWMLGKFEDSSEVLEALNDPAVFSPVALERVQGELGANRRQSKRMLALKARLQPGKDLTQEEKAREEAVWFDEDSDYEGFSQFILFLQQAENHTKLPQTVLLNFLSQNQNPTVAKNLPHCLRHAFKSWIFHNPDFGPILLDSMIPLLSICYADPVRLAAWIVVLLEQGLSPYVLFKTGVLQQFLLGNLAFMEDDDNVVRQFYDVLNRFPIAKPLIDIANELSVVASDDEANQAFKTYTLTGYIKANLPQLSISPISFVVPRPLEKTFKIFYTLFDKEFLINILLSCRNQLDIKHELRAILAEGGVDQQSLLVLLKQCKSNSELLAVFAEVLPPQIADEWIASNQSAVFYLLPASLDLLQKIPPQTLQGYINSSNKLDAIRVLNGILEAISTIPATLDSYLADPARKAIPGLIFRKIFDFLAKHPQLPADDFILVLQRLIARRLPIESVQSILDDCAIDYFVSHQAVWQAALENAVPLSERFNAIQDLYHEMRSMIALSTEVFDFPYVFSMNSNLDFSRLDWDFIHNFPKSKQAFLQVIINQEKLRAGDQFNLQETLNIIVPFQEPPEADAVTDYELAIITMMPTCHGEKLWKDAIQLLESEPINRKDWLTKKYTYSGAYSIAEPLTLLEVGILTRNIPLLEYLSNVYPTAPADIIRAMLNMRRMICVVVQLVMPNAL